MWILNICIFATAGENRAVILYFTKLILRTEKNSKGNANFFVFFIKFHVKVKNPSLSKQFPLLVQTHPF